jgi:5-methylcytosine-specific restriction endonuclease McrA
MKLAKIIKKMIKSKDDHFLSVDGYYYDKWKYLIKFILIFNKNYKICEIRRKKFKTLENFVVVGLKYTGKNVKRRTTGYAKNFIEKNKNSSCIYCQTKLTQENATSDHIVPISNGGNNCQVNLIVCCSSCNTERGNTNFIEFIKNKNKRYRNKKIFYI